MNLALEESVNNYCRTFHPETTPELGPLQYAFLSDVVEGTFTEQQGLFSDSVSERKRAAEYQAKASLREYFDDPASFDADPKQKRALFEQAVLYLRRAQRPDLIGSLSACFDALRMLKIQEAVGALDLAIATSPEASKTEAVRCCELGLFELTDYVITRMTSR